MAEECLKRIARFAVIRVTLAGIYGSMTVIQAIVAGTGQTEALATHQSGGARNKIQTYKQLHSYSVSCEKKHD